MFGSAPGHPPSDRDRDPGMNPSHGISASEWLQQVTEEDGGLGVPERKVSGSVGVRFEVNWRKGLRCLLVSSAVLEDV